MIKAILTRA